METTTVNQYEVKRQEIIERIAELEAALPAAERKVADTEAAYLSLPHVMEGIEMTRTPIPFEESGDIEIGSVIAYYVTDEGWYEGKSLTYMLVDKITAASVIGKKVDIYERSGIQDAWGHTSGRLSRTDEFKWSTSGFEKGVYLVLMEEQVRDIKRAQDKYNEMQRAFSNAERNRDDIQREISNLKFSLRRVREQEEWARADARERAYVALAAEYPNHFAALLEEITDKALAEATVEVD